MNTNETTVPDNTAVRVALWRALHVLVDAPPHVLEDDVGLRLIAPDEGWRQRGDMNPEFTKTFRAAIVAPARSIEDLVAEKAAEGVRQCVILGAGLDTFAQRRPEIASQLQMFEVDQDATQSWKRQRLIDLGYDVPEWLHLVPVDFESGASWQEEIAAAGFDRDQPAVVASSGLSMYLTREANVASLREIASLAPGSVLALSFLLTQDLVDPELRCGLEISARGAAASGTPFVSYFAPDDITALAREAGFTHVEHVDAAKLNKRYFSRRSDGLKMLRGEELIVATV